MDINLIIKGINKASLSAAVKDEANSVIRAHTTELEKMLDGLHYKPSTAGRDFCRDIVNYAMGLITPVLKRHSVQSIDGTNTYAYIYASITGEDPKKYLETA